MTPGIRSELRRCLKLRNRHAMDVLLIQLTLRQVSTEDEIRDALEQELEIADQETKDYWLGPCDCNDPTCPN